MFRTSLAALLVCTSFGLAADDATFNGLKATEWMAMAKDDVLPRKRKAAILALGQMITDKQATRDTILPVIVKAMRSDSQAAVRLQAALVMGQQNAETLAGYMTDLSEGLRQEKDSSVRREIANSIGRIGKAAQGGVKPLIDALNDSTPATRAAVAQALGRIGAGANAAADPLITLTKDADTGVRYSAIFALGRIDAADPDAAVKAIITALSVEESQQNRVALQSALLGGGVSHARNGELVTGAVVSLGLLGVKSTAVVQAIAGHLKDPDTDVRQQAVLSLGKLTIAAKVVEADLKAAIAKDVDKQVRVYAVQTLASAYGNDPEPLITFLADRFKFETDIDVRIAIVDELGNLGPAGNNAIPALREAQRDTQIKVREAATAAIKRITKPVPPPKPDQP